ncbi:hypothetical protein SPFL3102_02660 [Sporomusaceae bacterium FL31]|nr:hypothetical protein SPFL3101_02635 [Sporomusaceae bacterium FL31]GCE34833.1 hypothetical protein SPFL3102_02660 [Sporomusaceae bacterium]
MINIDQAKSFIANNWKYIIGTVVVAVLIYFTRAEYQDWKQHIKDQAAKPAATTELPPQIINEGRNQKPSER